MLVGVNTAIMYWVPRGVGTLALLGRRKHLSVHYSTLHVRPTSIDAITTSPHVVAAFVV